MNTYYNLRKAFLVGLIILIVIINGIVFKKIYHQEDSVEAAVQEQQEAYEIEEVELDQVVDETEYAQIVGELEDDQTVEEAEQVETISTQTRPIDLFQLQALYKNGGNMIFSHGSSTQRPDNVGNLYSANAYEIYASGDDRSITFPLDGKYNTLSGSLAIRQNESHESLRLDFYNGDVLIGQTEMLKDGIRPISFSIDVSGVVDLTIRATTESSCGFAYTEGLFLE